MTSQILNLIATLPHWIIENKRINVIFNNDSLEYKIYDVFTSRVLNTQSVEIIGNPEKTLTVLKENDVVLTKDNKVKCLILRKPSEWPSDIPVEHKSNSHMTIGLYKRQNLSSTTKGSAFKWKDVWRLTDHKNNTRSTIKTALDDSLLSHYLRDVRVEFPTLNPLFVRSYLSDFSFQCNISMHSELKSCYLIPPPSNPIQESLDENITYEWLWKGKLIKLIENDNELIFGGIDIITKEIFGPYKPNFNEENNTQQIKNYLRNSFLRINDKNDLEFLPLHNSSFWPNPTEQNSGVIKLCWTKNKPNDTTWYRVWCFYNTNQKVMRIIPAENSEFKGYLKDLELTDITSYRNDYEIEDVQPFEPVGDLESLTLRKVKRKSTINSEVELDRDCWGVTILSAGTSSKSCKTGWFGIFESLQQGHAELTCEGVKNGQHYGILAHLTTKPEEDSQLEIGKGRVAIHEIHDTVVKGIRNKSKTWIIPRETALSLIERIYAQQETPKSFDTTGTGFLIISNWSFAAKEVVHYGNELINHKEELTQKFFKRLFKVIQNHNQSWTDSSDTSLHPLKQPGTNLGFVNYSKSQFFREFPRNELTSNNLPINIVNQTTRILPAIIGLFSLQAQAANISVYLTRCIVDSYLKDGSFIPKINFSASNNEQEEFYNCLLWVIEMIRSAGIKLPSPDFALPDYYINWLNDNPDFVFTRRKPSDDRLFNKISFRAKEVINSIYAFLTPPQPRYNSDV